MAVNAYGQYTISVVDDGVGIKSKQDYYTLSNQKDSLDGAKSYFEKEVSGAVASFSDGAENAPMGVVVDIDPVQDLHGYDNPWPAGGGNNLAQLIEDGTVPSISNGQLVQASGCRTDYIKVTPSTSYVFSYSATASNTLYWLFYDSNKSFLRYGSSNDNPKSIVISSDAEYVMLRTSQGLSAFAWFQFESGSTATAYSPYSNICPISGWTKATISHSGADTSNPTEYEIPFATEVYGGKLNVETGECVVDKAIITFDGSSDESWTMTSVKAAYTKLNALKKESNYSQSMKCDKLRPVNNQANVSNTDYSISGYSDYSGSYPNQNWAYLKLTAAYDSVASIREWLTANPVTIVYTLATPITIALSPVEIRSILGDNNV